MHPPLQCEIHAYKARVTTVPPNLVTPPPGECRSLAYPRFLGADSPEAKTCQVTRSLRIWGSGVTLTPQARVITQALPGFS